MNMHKTEVEIVHSAYQHLWEQMQTKRLVQRLSGSRKQSARITVKSSSR